MFKKIIWYFIIVIFTTGFTAASSGFYNALKITMGQSPDSPKVAITEDNEAKVPVVSKNSNTIRILVMGDSIAKGTGDEKGKGFTTYLPEYFKNQTPKDIEIQNIGVDGQQSNGLLEQLKNENIHSLIAGSDFIVVSIGGNDLRRIQSSGSMTKDDEFRDRQDSYIGNLKEMLKVLRKSSPEAVVIFIGLYNPYEDRNAFENTRLLSIWNYNTEQIIEEDKKAVFIPTYDIFKFNLKKYIALDGLHPNAAGYQTISSRVAKSVEMLMIQ